MTQHSDPVWMQRALALERSLFEKLLDSADKKEGIAAFRAQPADLVLTDIVMPEMDEIGRAHV